LRRRLILSPPSSSDVVKPESESDGGGVASRLRMLVLALLPRFLKETTGSVASAMLDILWLGVKILNGRTVK
jgi:hypothetical protein